MRTWLFALLLLSVCNSSVAQCISIGELDNLLGKSLEVQSNFAKLKQYQYFNAENSNGFKTVEYSNAKLGSRLIFHTDVEGAITDVEYRFKSTGPCYDPIKNYLSGFLKQKEEVMYGRVLFFYTNVNIGVVIESPSISQNRPFYAVTVLNKENYTQWLNLKPYTK